MYFLLVRHPWKGSFLRTLWTSHAKIIALADTAIAILALGVIPENYKMLLREVELTGHHIPVTSLGNSKEATQDHNAKLMILIKQYTEETKI